MTNLTIPTHFRFLNEKEAKYYYRNTKQWIPINEIHIRCDNDYYDISAASFAWVTYDVKNPNLEFKTSKFTKKDLKEFRNE